MRRLNPLVTLLVWVLAISAFPAGCIAAGRGLPPAAEMLASFALTLAFVLWVDLDARRRGIVPCHDFGFLVAVFFPASLLWYVFWSRGGRGALTLALLASVVVVPPLLALAAAVVRVLITG